MVSVLGAAHLIFGLWNFSQLSSQHEERLRDEIVTRPREFDALLEQTARSLGELALQLASAYASVAEDRGSAGLAEIETFGGFVTLEFFDAGKKSLAAWDASGMSRTTAIPGYATAVRLVLANSRPTSLVSCLQECALYAFVPVFDRDGRNLVVVVGQPLSETLVAFQRLGGADAAILREQTDSAPLTGPLPVLWGKIVMAVTNAPVLLPLLQQLSVAIPPEPGKIVKAMAGSRALRLSMAPLPRSEDQSAQVLFVVDETAALGEIRAQIMRSLGLNALTLLLSAVAVYLLLTPALRRLGNVTRALPLLAERQFSSSREQLGITKLARRKDEIAVLRDATLALSYRLETLDKAEAASEEKSRFLATMSHEIRTPMNGILGLLELLEGENMSAEQRDAVRIARDSGQTLLRVIDDILDFSRLEASQIQIEKIPFRLAEVVEDAAETLAPSARSKRLRLITFIDPALPAMVIGDPLRLRQILFNLCSNAIKFTSRGRVQVRAEPAPGVVYGDQRVRFHVIDTGIGLPPDARERLFRPFVQADSTTTRRFGGTGLGLSIVRGLVTRMGGVVDFASIEGKGSDFWFELDFPTAADEAGSEDETGPLAGTHVRVDLPDHLEAGDLESYLVTAGAQLGEADGGLSLHESTVDAQAHAMLEIRRDHRVMDVISRPLRMRDLVRRLRAAAGLERIQTSAEIVPAIRVARTDAPLVLVADDHPVNQQVIQRQLNLLGYRTTLASDGLEALERLKEQDYDLLLADLHMPNMDGFQLTTAVRAAEAAGLRPRRLPVVALTAAALSKERAQCLTVGMDGFLLKPAGLDRLRDVLERFIPIPVPAPDAAAVAAPVPAQPPAQILRAGPAPIDRELLLDLVGEDEAFAGHLMREFLRINLPVMDDLARQLETVWEGKSVRSLAHRLLGSARTAAATELATALAELERCAEQDLAVDAATAWAKVRLEFDAVRDYILAQADSKVPK